MLMAITLAFDEWKVAVFVSDAERDRGRYVFITRIHSQMALTMNRQQGSSKESFPGWENFVTAVAFHVILPQLACNILVSWEALFR